MFCQSPKYPTSHFPINAIFPPFLHKCHIYVFITDSVNGKIQIRNTLHFWTVLISNSRLIKWLFKILWNLQENTCNGFLFLVRFQASFFIEHSLCLFLFLLLMKPDATTQKFCFVIITCRSSVFIVFFGVFNFEHISELFLVFLVFLLLTLNK